MIASADDNFVAIRERDDAQHTRMPAAFTQHDRRLRREISAPHDGGFGGDNDGAFQRLPLPVLHASNSSARIALSPAVCAEEKAQGFLCTR